MTAVFGEHSHGPRLFVQDFLNLSTVKEVKEEEDDSAKAKNSEEDQGDKPSDKR